MKELSAMKQAVSISKTMIVVMAILFGGATLSACSTWEGITNDVESGWDSLFGKGDKKS